MKRRDFLAGAGVAAGAAAATLASSFPKPALAQERIEWKMVTSWPKGLPGLDTGAQRLAQSIADLSDGRIVIQVFSAGELVPALGCFDAVADGTADMAHDASYYHLSKSPACGFYTAVPFGLTATELNAWVYFGGGQELWDELYEPFGLKAFLAGNTGCQMGGWFRKEINAVGDLAGLKFRMPGQGGQALSRLDVTVVTLPGGEIFANLQSGAIDGTEWVGPYNDLSLGFYKVAKYYYWPGFHEPGSGLQCTLGRAKYEALPNDLKQIVATACNRENDLMLAEFNGRSGAALASLVNEHGVELKQFPKEVLEAFGAASGEVMQEVYDSGDEITRKICESFFQFRRDIRRWTRVSDQAYTNARSLEFEYPQG
jgi:TRAP-type mannitol/chloroaromatic compound transport system substrate-binding protein